MPSDSAVANPPAGGDQSQASTNDENINTILQNEPYVVTIAAHGSVGVLGRYRTEADANKARDAFAANRPAFVDVKVVKENDPNSGLPTLVADVTAGELDADTAPAPRSAKPTK